MITEALRHLHSKVLFAVLEQIESVPENGESSNSETLLQQLLVEVLAIGVEELVDRLQSATVQSLALKTSGKKSAKKEAIESVIKESVLGFLNTVSDELALQLAQDAGISTEDSTADLARVMLFDEIVMLGMEGVLGLVDHRLLMTLATGALGKAKGDDCSLIEQLMVHIFHLETDASGASPRKNKGGSSRRARNRILQKESDKEKKKPTPPKQPNEENDDDDDDDEDVAPSEEAKSTQKRPRKTEKLFQNKTEVHKKRVAELRDFCEANDLTTDGKKADLVARVWNYVSELDDE